MFLSVCSKGSDSPKATLSTSAPPAGSVNTALLNAQVVFMSENPCNTVKKLRKFPAQAVVVSESCPVGAINATEQEMYASPSASSAQ